jgi:serine protease Do
MRQKILFISILFLTFCLGSFVTFSIVQKSELKIRETITNIIVDEKGISESVKKVYDSVVLIESYKGRQLTSSGTGFVYKKDNENGYIITNEHVISGASKVIVTFYNGEEAEATILGGDVFADVAVISVPAENVLAIADIGNSRETVLGETVFTVGTPVGKEYMGTVTRGILSGKDRMVTVSVSGLGAEDWIMRVLQTDAAINPGNSGGPLVNVEGEVIGINSLKFVRQEIEGMGFAIPIEYALTHVDKLEQGLKLERPLLGVTLIDVTDNVGLYRNNLLVDEGIIKGAVIESVVEDTPASKGGLKRGDIILKIDDNELKNKAYLRYILYKYNIGDTITVTYYRDKKEETVDIKLDQIVNDGT